MTQITIEQYREQLQKGFQVCGLPRTSWDTLLEYIIVGRPSGEFLTSVLSNDLLGAVKKADDLNIQRLRDYVAFLEGHAPALCWGSTTNVREWMRKGGIMGLTQNVQVVVPNRLDVGD